MPMTAPCGLPWASHLPRSSETASQSEKTGADSRASANHAAACPQMRDIIEEYRELQK